MTRTILVHAFALAVAGHGIGATETPFIGYRGDGSGVFPADCKPVTTWKEFAATKKVPAGKLTAELPDASSPEVLENIVWKTPMPNFTESSPIVVGKKVFTLSEPGWPVDTGDAPILICVDADTGAILWQRPVDQFDALPESQQQEAKESRRAYWVQHRAFRNVQLRFNLAYAAKDQNAYDLAIADAAAAGFAKSFDKHKGDVAASKGFGLFAGQGHHGMPEIAKKYTLCTPNWSYTTMGMTFATPCSDGRWVYATTAYGGMAAYDLDGNRKWITWPFAPDSKRKALKPTNPDSYAGSSPLLVKDRLIQRINGWIFVLDTATGAVVWEHQVSTDTKDVRYVANVSSPVRITVGGKDLVYVVRGLIVDPADGRLLAKPLLPEMAGSAHHTPLYDRERNLIFWGTGGHSGDKSMGDFQYAARFASEEGGKLTATIVWKNGKDVAPRMGDMTCVLHQGRIYFPDGTAVDAETGKVLPGRPGQYKWASHGLLIVDGNLWGAPDGQDCEFHIVPLGSDGTLGKPSQHFLEHMGPWGQDKMRQFNAYGTDRKGAWYHWATSRSYPFFSGNRVFFRTFDHLYCIGDKSKPFVPSAAFMAR